MLRDNWGYDRYPGVCHIIPNAGVCFMALLYGQGAFDRTIEIATMAGWDTDCNAGNVGTILGVACGVEGIPRRYLDPINDGIVCSGISGYLNILDIPSFCRETALLGYRLAGEPAPQALLAAYRPGEIYFDFELPGSTHNMRVSNSYFCQLRHSTKHAFAGTGSLRITLDRMVRGDQCRVFYKPFYLIDDFSDERYSTVFSPTVYPGQTVCMQLYLDQYSGNETPGFAPYIRTASDGKIHLQGYRKLKQAEWMEVSFRIPDTAGDCVTEVGILVEGYSTAKSRTMGQLYLDEFRIFGSSAYSIDFTRQRKNFAAITPFSMDHGAWELEEGRLKLMRIEPAFAFTGSYYARNYTVTAPVTAENGNSHLLLCRAQGAMRFYAAGFGEPGKAVIYKNDFGFKKLKECDFPWQQDETYNLTLCCDDKKITLSINGQALIEAEDEAFDHGMFGCGSLAMGRTAFGTFQFTEH